MIWMLLLLAGVLLAIAQKYWAGETLRKLSLESAGDCLLAEPGQRITWQITLRNHSPLPALFARLQLHFPVNTVFEANDVWVKGHCRQTLQYWHVEEKFSILPRRSVKRSVAFSLPERGQYSIGSYRLSAGDLLGFREEALNGPGGKIVVMPREAHGRKSMDALGSFLGDRSVRRFILEDPILTVGFRDYTGREPMKTISWSRTATAGSLQVKQFDYTAQQTAMILLDVEGGQPDELEGCFRLMRSVCQTLEARKIPYGLRTNGSLPGPLGQMFFLAEGLGSSHLTTILYGLGRADYACYYSLRYLTQQALQNRKQNEAYILITPRITDSVNIYMRKLHAAMGNPVCVLTGDEEAQL